MEKNFQTQTPERNLPKDLILHLLAIITLYWFLINFAILLWQFASYYFLKDFNYLYYIGFTDPIKFAVVSLIIIFPIFIIVPWYLNKIYADEPQAKESKMAKWLIRHSGGLIKSEKMANYVLLAMAVIIFITSLFIFYSQMTPRF